MSPYQTLKTYLCRLFCCITLSVEATILSVNKFLLFTIRSYKGKACMGERSRVYRVMVGKTEGKGPVGRSRRRWEDNIKMDHFNLLTN